MTCGAEQRGRRNDADLSNAETEFCQVGWEDDRGKAITEPTRRACGIQQGDVGGPSNDPPSHLASLGCFNRHP
jgi:hypothetical protein